MSIEENPERRDFIRMQVAAPVRYRVAGSDAPFAEGRTENLSATGILFDCDQEFGPGTELELELAPTHPSLPPLQAQASVIRSERCEQGFRVAAELRVLS